MQDLFQFWTMRLGFRVDSLEIKAYCTACNEPKEGCYGITKLWQPSKGRSYICQDCLPFVDEAIATYPCSLYHHYYPTTINLGGEQVQTKPVVKPATPSGFNKWYCNKCNLVFTSKHARASHVDERHRI